MKKFLLWVGLVNLVFTAAAATAVESCASVSVMARVEVTGRDVTLADLLAPGTCPALLAEAVRLRLGSAPLPGSDRVLEGAAVRALLLKATSGRIDFSSVALRMPERVIVHRAAPPESEFKKIGVLVPLPRKQTPAPAVRAGELVRLLWEQDGIRSIVPVTCLDRGAVGERVRARIEPGGRIIAATVMEPGLLRAIL